MINRLLNALHKIDVMKYLHKLAIAGVMIFISLCSSAQLSQPIDFPLPPNMPAANVSAAEYYFDADPGFGKGHSINITSGADVSANNIPIDINSLTTGVHRLFTRTKNASNVWSLSNIATFFIIPPGALFPPNTNTINVTAAECLFDNDPGFGKGSVIPVTPGADVSASNVALEIDTLSVGVHRLFVRTQNSSGAWSLTNVATFFIVTGTALFPVNPGVSNINKAEYFLDTDPGFGNGTSISVSSGADISANNIAVDISSLADGIHRVYVRTQNSTGNWSLTNVASFYIVPVNFDIPPNPVTGNITKLEYFFDTDPGFGKGTIITVPPTSDLSNYTFAADISGLKNDTTHTLYIRTFDDWSLTNTKTFILGQLLPVTWISFNAKAVNNQVLLNWKTAQEKNTDHFDVERSLDGEHFSTIGTVASAQNSAAESDYSFRDDKPVHGIGYYRLKQVDLDGHFTYSIVITVKMNTRLSVKILENPVHSNLHLQITGTDGKPLHLLIVDAAGKKYKTLITGEGSKEVNTQSLSSGMYYLVYQTDGHTISLPFTKE